MIAHRAHQIRAPRSRVHNRPRPLRHVWRAATLMYIREPPWRARDTTLALAPYKKITEIP
jgi:hypothetical protein